jgi:dihydrofolate synthase/folylpolyglutamate synthase
MSGLLPLSLARRQPGRIRPELAAFRSVLARLGDPQWRFPSALVVGTNGKGSTAAMLDAVLAGHGLRTGLYTSPHLVRVEERIRIAGKPVASDELVRQLAALDPFDELTFFETLTAAAFLAFAEGGVDCVVLEAGMGGRWDATRAASSAIAGLTNVGSDHGAWLGERREERAADKGAALAAAPFAVLGHQVEPDVAALLGAPHALAASDLVGVERLGPRLVRTSWPGGSAEVVLPLGGSHQLHNLQLALALALGAVRLGWLDALDPESVIAGLGRTHWPGRLSSHRVFGRRVLVDCAHNAEGALVLADYLADQPVLYHLLFSCLDDKPVETMARTLWPTVGNVAVCSLDDDRAMPLARLRAAFPDCQSAPSVRQALALLPDPVVVAGSVRLAGELLAGAQETS